MLALTTQTTDAFPVTTNFLDERAGSFFLRILPLGGSITLGWGSSTGNGSVRSNEKPRILQL